VASEGGSSEDRSSGSHEPRECKACRGTGKVISNLGGTASRIPCPWCGGAGLRLAGQDAQAKWLDGDVCAPSG